MSLAVRSLRQLRLNSHTKDFKNWGHLIHCHDYPSYLAGLGESYFRSEAGTSVPETWHEFIVEVQSTVPTDPRASPPKVTS